MRGIVIVLALGASLARAQAQQQKLTIIKSDCAVNSCTAPVGAKDLNSSNCISCIITASINRTKYILTCDKAKACTPLVAKDVWPFVYAVDSDSCKAHAIKGPDGNNYPVRCIKLLGGTRDLIYTIVKDDDYWCYATRNITFCKK